MRVTRLLAVMLLLAPLFPALASAQSGEDDMVALKDGSEISREATTYRLTKQMLPRFASAFHEIILVRRSDVAAFAAIRPGTPIPPKMAAIYASAKISRDEWYKFYTAAITALLVGDVTSNTAAYPILDENIRFVNANAAAMKQMQPDMAEMTRHLAGRK